MWGGWGGPAAAAAEGSEVSRATRLERRKEGLGARWSRRLLLLLLGQRGGGGAAGRLPLPLACGCVVVVGDAAGGVFGLGPPRGQLHTWGGEGEHGSALGAALCRQHPAAGPPHHPLSGSPRRRCWGAATSAPRLRDYSSRQCCRWGPGWSATQGAAPCRPLLLLLLRGRGAAAAARRLLPLLLGLVLGLPPH